MTPAYLRAATGGIYHHAFEPGRGEEAVEPAAQRGPILRVEPSAVDKGELPDEGQDCDPPA